MVTVATGGWAIAGGAKAASIASITVAAMSALKSRTRRSIFCESPVTDVPKDRDSTRGTR